MYARAPSCLVDGCVSRTMICVYIAKFFPEQAKTTPPKRGMLRVFAVGSDDENVRKVNRDNVLSV